LRVTHAVGFVSRCSPYTFSLFWCALRLATFSHVLPTFLLSALFLFVCLFSLFLRRERWPPHYALVWVTGMEKRLDSLGLHPTPQGSPSALLPRPSPFHILGVCRALPTCCLCFLSTVLISVLSATAVTESGVRGLLAPLRVCANASKKKKKEINAMERTPCAYRSSKDPLFTAQQQKRTLENHSSFLQLCVCVCVCVCTMKCDSGFLPPSTNISAECVRRGGGKRHLGGTLIHLKRHKQKDYSVLPLSFSPESHKGHSCSA
jgi:hypothetical protein